MTIGFGVLGEIQARSDGAAVDLGPARQRSVFAALVVDINRTVPVEVLVDRVWGLRPPQRAKPTLYSYVSRLRQALDTIADEASAETGVSIARRPAGYALLADPGTVTVDVHLFRDLAGQAGATDDPRAAALFERALGLWRGEPFAGVDTPWFNSLRESLLGERHACRLDRNDVQLRRGHHAALLPELAACHDTHPLDERLAGQLMLALYRSGRAADALRCFEQVRRALAEELGSDPSDELRRLHQRVLVNDPDIAAPGTAPDAALAVTGTTAPAAVAPAAAAPASAPTSGAPSPPYRTVPRQLPSVSRWFTGRQRELAELDKVLRPTGRPGAAVSVCAVSGSGGIGKTSLAVHWAHQNTDRFPDGQLYADLRGFDPSEEPLASATAIRVFLDALGVAPGSIPVDQEALAGLYRSLVADRRMLIVLDNAVDAAQVAALLPGGAGCAVLVTSRRRLTGLAVTQGAHLLPLDVLSVSESRELLGRHLGEDRLAAEPEAVTAVLEHCTGLPLALSVVGARAAAGAGFPLAALAAELHDESARLDALDAGDLSANVRAVCHVSYRALSDGAAEVFRLLGAAAPGPEIGLPAAGSLLSRSATAARAALRELETVHLVQQPVPGRYRMHDLIRLYAAERAALDQQEESRARALRRVMDFYLHTAYAGHRVLSPLRHHHMELEPPLDGVIPQPMTDQSAVMAWFRAEHTCLVAAQRLAERNGWDVLVWQFARVLDGFLWRQGRLDDLVALWRTGLASAERHGEAGVRAWAHRRLAHARARLGHHDDALRHGESALAAAEEAGDLAEQARIHDVFAWAWARQGDDRQALAHVRHTLRLQRLGHDPVATANALNAVGWYEARLGEYEQALAHCEEGLEIQGRHGFRDGEACTLDSLGFIAHAATRHEEALAYYRRAHTLFHDLGNLYEEANTLANLGDVHLALGEPDEARHNWQRAVTLYHAQHRAEDARRLQDKLSRAPR
ncbi:AfsR/SARP family transcriptional regulator [Streptomyces odonnellii]|uniref:AfsR/SARP family transcriptional regulator n=1 Tax=Streptomyces odonnellii TaxID=1417980 RepID=UPI0006265339|nr:BTAD domain-containing putative transcriptional regulator [Streptomyces odonnellii]